MELSKLLRTGALPASMNYIPASTVGATLGADSIREGVTAAIVGIVVVMAFMLIYYRGSGINADLALIFNLIILLGIWDSLPRFRAPSGGGVLVLTLTCPALPVSSSQSVWAWIQTCSSSSASAKRFAPARRLRRQWTGLCPSVGHDRRHPRHHHRLGGDSVYLWHRSGEGFCHHPDGRSCGQSFHGRLCLASHL